LLDTHFLASCRDESAGPSLEEREKPDWPLLSLSQAVKADERDHAHAVIGSKHKDWHAQGFTEEKALLFSTSWRGGASTTNTAMIANSTMWTNGLSIAK